MQTTPLTHWSDVPMFWLHDASPLTDEERLTALAEYRERGCIRDVVLAAFDPSAEDNDDLWAAGPEPEEIDWSGFVAVPNGECDE